jgi:hypothetical protein
MNRVDRRMSDKTLDTMFSILVVDDSDQAWLSEYKRINKK